MPIARCPYCRDVIVKIREENIQGYRVLSCENCLRVLSIK